MILTLKSDNLKFEGWNIWEPISKGLEKISLNPDCYRAEYIMQISKEFMHRQ